MRVVGIGPEFDEGRSTQDGHIRVDLGLDTPFLCEDIPLHEDDQLYVKKNVEQLVAFTTEVEKNCGVETRLLWSGERRNPGAKADCATTEAELNRSQLRKICGPSDHRFRAGQQRKPVVAQGLVLNHHHDRIKECVQRRL